MKIAIDKTRTEASKRAADCGAVYIQRALRERGTVRVILATGSSQFDVLRNLVSRNDIDWSKCTVFHLDEYIGLSRSHRASFVNYLRTRFVNLIPELGHFEAVNGEADNVDAEIMRLSAEVTKAPIDVAFVGIGENGHLAFNDPPADFMTEAPYLRVTLDQPCRTQQINEGWFETIEDVPTEAITMGIRQIMNSRAIICTVPDERKAIAVRNAVEGPVSNLCPASILQKHGETRLFLDKSAGGRLTTGCGRG
ncbi:glucosamine-6-phosphate deaminase [Hoeflea sp. TYP-13]|uniref:glucosamine-6-phosphate deaminase n=1 Tax=Hoeflea sp. TYP-13 TaxID=3230023 RepID=UPI0034C6B87A